MRQLPFLLAAASLALSCTGRSSYNEVTVIGKDYAFELPDTLPPGPTAFVLENRGTVRHELGMGLLKEKFPTIESAIEAYEAGQDPLEAKIGYIIVGPGKRSPGRLLVNLQSGRTYGVTCNLQDSPDAPDHDELGMVGDFVVR